MATLSAVSNRPLVSPVTCDCIHILPGKARTVPVCLEASQEPSPFALGLLERAVRALCQKMWASLTLRAKIAAT